MTGRHDTPVGTETLPKESLVQDNVRRIHDMKSHKRPGPATKSSRPPLEIYSPRNNIKKYASKIGSENNGLESSVLQHSYTCKEMGSKNGTKVHFVENNVVKKSSPPPPNSLPYELKSALKRSKSFTTDESRVLENIGFERNAFPIEYQGLIKRAVLDPNALSCQKLMELVRLICSKAVESVQYSEPAAQLCFSIIEKEHDHTFLESLQNCCREWYHERDKLLRSPFVQTMGTTAAGMRRWTAFVFFLTELYLQVKKHCQILQPPDGEKGQMFGPHSDSPMAHLALTLQTLLYECANVILRPPSVNSEGEIEILRKMLNTIGKQLEADYPQKMQQLVVHLRDAFIHPSINAQIRKTLLEVIELHASGWQLDLPQTLYYFPYTRL